ncbi:MAG: 3-oxoadipyl-CoA thiolase [Deltaproteobacteria bacterium]|jgi:3-oxoadipyl-CoA thiolase|nr:3-oxoadipyl-CoA thiolase [Deltaproteobacteria bacterium]
MNEAYICDFRRTPIGRYGGALARVRADDLAAIPIRALMESLPQLDWGELDDVIYGCVNQAGEDNRNVARMALLLAGLPEKVPGCTINRLCGSGMNAVGLGMQAIMTGQADLVIAGGVESMSRSPLVLPKADTPFSRKAEIYDSTIGWRFANPRMKEMYGLDSMPETAENVARDYAVSRADQDSFALRSQDKALLAREKGVFAGEICPVRITLRGESIIVDQDEAPRKTDLEALAALQPLAPGGTVTAGNSSGINDGAAALLLAGPPALKKFSLRPAAKILGMAVAGVPPRIMGIGPLPAAQKVLKALNLRLRDMDIIELNEAFASQALAVLRGLGLEDDDKRVNPNGGAIALGHPLGMSGARIVLTAARELQSAGKRYALCAMCIGVGQGIAVVLERA